MEEILDQQFNEKDETRINRVIAIIRFVASALFLFLILRVWYFSWYNFDRNTPEYLGGLIMTVLMLGMIGYNIRQFIVEWKTPFVYLQFSKVFVVIFIGLNSVFIFSIPFLFYTVLFLQKQSLSNETILQLILLICLTVIVLREITYLRRATRLKRLKNQ